MPVDERLYAAVRRGDISVLEEYKNQQQQLITQLTPYNNTVLHVAADRDSDFSSEEQVGEFLAVVGGLNLVFSLNCNGDTCIHLAAKRGHVNFVTAIISYMISLRQTEVEGGIKGAHDLLRIVNKMGDTALHEAVRSGRIDMVKLLVENVGNFSHPPNKAGTSPLYLAVRMKHKEIALWILNNSSSPSYVGPDGMTVLHIAATYLDEGFVEMILGKEQSLAKHVDDLGWSPLHFAAYFGRDEAASMLLKEDKHMAYQTIKDDSRTALHLAAMKGHVGVMKEILKICPDSLDTVTSGDQNVRQLAEANDKSKVLKFLDKKYGDKKLHREVDGYYTSFCDNTFIYHPYIEKMMISKENSKEIQRAFEEETANLKDRVNTQLVIATLLTTITFAAGFTLPGGYDDDGLATLSKKAVFQVFMITDTFAMILSTGVVIMHYRATFNKGEALYLYNVSTLILMSALIAMMIAFTSGLYVVLPHGLAVAVSVMTAIFTYGTINITIHRVVKAVMPELIG